MILLILLTWKQGTTILGTSTTATFTYIYPASAGGSSSITAEIQTVCEDKITLNKSFLIPYITKIWDKTFGGNGTDEQSVVVATSDGGFLLGGRSTSNILGDKTENGRGSDDFWVVKINANGQKQWDRTFGGTNSDVMNHIVPTSDGGYLLGGRSNSNASGDKTENSRGNEDFWIIKVNANGVKQWDKTFGGTGDDIGTAIVSTPDNAFLIGGGSNSNASGEKSENSRGGADYWILKMDTNGNKQWDKTIGGSGEDQVYTLLSIPSGGFLIFGFSDSNISGEKSENSRGGRDFWTVKVR
jgi:hypothetical protein